MILITCISVQLFRILLSILESCEWNALLLDQINSRWGSAVTMHILIRSSRRFHLFVWVVTHWRFCSCFLYCVEWLMIRNGSSDRNWCQRWLLHHHSLLPFYVKLDFCWLSRGTKVSPNIFPIITISCDLGPLVGTRGSTLSEHRRFNHVNFHLLQARLIL